MRGPRTFSTSTALGFSFSYDADQFWKHVSFICMTAMLAANRKWLTRYASCQKVWPFRNKAVIKLTRRHIPIRARQTFSQRAAFGCFSTSRKQAIARSITARCSKSTALAMPSARPPAPLKSSASHPVLSKKVRSFFLIRSALLRFTLPDYFDLPSCSSQAGNVFDVPLTIICQFGKPEAKPRLRQPCKRAARMAMPKTAVNEDHLAQSRKHQVGLARKARVMQPIPVSASVSD